MTERVSPFSLYFILIFSGEITQIWHMFKRCLQERFVKCNRLFTARTLTPFNIVRFFVRVRRGSENVE